jgi:hypothetical protein
MSDVPLRQDQIGATIAAKRSTATRAISIAMNAIAPLFWIYVICKLFIFDIDLYLIRQINPSLIWIADYRFFLLIGALATMLLVSRRFTVMAWVTFTLLYPLILFLWRLPILIFKRRSWYFYSR